MDATQVKVIRNKLHHLFDEGRQKDGINIPLVIMINSCNEYIDEVTHGVFWDDEHSLMYALGLNSEMSGPLNTICPMRVACYTYDQIIYIGARLDAKCTVNFVEDMKQSGFSDQTTVDLYKEKMAKMYQDETYITEINSPVLERGEVSPGFKPMKDPKDNW